MFIHLTMALSRRSCSSTGRSHGVQVPLRTMMPSFGVLEVPLDSWQVLGSCVVNLLPVELGGQTGQTGQTTVSWMFHGCFMDVSCKFGGFWKLFPQDDLPLISPLVGVLPRNEPQTPWVQNQRAKVTMLSYLHNSSYILYTGIYFPTLRSSWSSIGILGLTCWAYLSWPAYNLWNLSCVGILSRVDLDKSRRIMTHALLWNSIDWPVMFTTSRTRTSNDRRW